MTLKNYSTKIPVHQTVSEIEQILAAHGASDIWKQFDGAGNIICINFAVNTKFGKMPFKLPMETEKIVRILKDDKKAQGKYGRYKAADIDIARRTGWRIIKDWIDAQMALIDIRLVEIEQVFLPYAYNMQNNQTLYESFKERKFTRMLMTSEQNQGKPEEK